MTDSGPGNVTVEDVQLLAERFEAQRVRLRALAQRMLGSLSEADDALQEAWLRMCRADTSQVDNLAGWLTTVVGRVCLDLLRIRAARREEPLEALPPDRGATAATDAADPERQALLADSIGVALLVVLDTLTPAERLAFVLHDLFGVPYRQIAPTVARSTAATRQLASRARRRVRAAAAVPEADPDRQRPVVAAFLAAARGGDVDRLVAVLADDVVVRADAADGTPTLLRGAHAVARQAVAFSRRAAAARLALVDGAVAVVVAPQGHLATALTFDIVRGRIVAVDIVTDPHRLRGLDLADLPSPSRPG
jgi:RNA polymerase sigma-70 factor (ECF subfamily)